MQINSYSEITPEILDLSRLSEKTSQINTELYKKYDVKRGLRDISGQGVLAGLTEIGEIHAYDMVDGKLVPCEGKLSTGAWISRSWCVASYRKAASASRKSPICCSLGELPNPGELTSFRELLGFLPFPAHPFCPGYLMKAPSKDMMNTLARSVLTLYSYDNRGDDISISNVLRQSRNSCPVPDALGLWLQAYAHYHDGKSLYIHRRSRSCLQRRIFFTPASRQQVHRLRGQDSRHRPGASYGARRR